MAKIRIGVQLQPQHCTVAQLRDAWRAADAIGVDSIWVWDHFYPLHGPPDGAHFEGWSLLAAMAADTSRARLGAMVSCNTYRNPDLLADMARTVDHISGGRMYLGIGAGWFERDYDEYGYPFATARERQRALIDGLERIAERVRKLTPPPVGPLPIMIGASGERHGLRIVARYADAWNTWGTPEHFAHKASVLDRHCAEVGRDPAQIERTVLIDERTQAEGWRQYIDAGAEHVIVSLETPFGMDRVARMVDEAAG